MANIAGGGGGAYRGKPNTTKTKRRGLALGKAAKLTAKKAANMAVNPLSVVKAPKPGVRRAIGQTRKSAVTSTPKPIEQRQYREYRAGERLQGGYVAPRKTMGATKPRGATKPKSGGLIQPNTYTQKSAGIASRAAGPKVFNAQQHKASGVNVAKRVSDVQNKYNNAVNQKNKLTGKAKAMTRGRGNKFGLKKKMM